MPTGRPRGSKKITPSKNNQTTELQNVSIESKPKYKCSSCGKEYEKQKGNFPASQSPMYKYNNCFLHSCNRCLDSMYEKYVEELKDEEQSMRRVFSKYDIYFDLSCFAASAKKGVGNSRIKSYISKLNLGQYSQKTYDDTLNEEDTGTITSIDEIKDNKNIKLTQKSVKFWGIGYTPEEYRMLDDEYSNWIVRENNGQQPDKKLEACLKQACQALVDIQRARVSNNAKDVATFNKVYIDALQAAGLKPIQSDNTSMAEKNSLGVLIEKWEQTEPVPDIAQEFKDVDKINHYIDVFFKGHLSRMFGMNNDTQEIYNEEILKYKVSLPKIEDGE